MELFLLSWADPVTYAVVLWAGASPGLPYTGRVYSLSRKHRERACYDPKDSELCLAEVKPQETGVEAFSRCDVQIHGVSLA